MKKGIYKLTKDIVDTDFRTIANSGDIVKVTGINIEKLFSGNRYELYVSFEMFGIPASQEVRFYEESEFLCVQLFERLFKLLII